MGEYAVDRHLPIHEYQPIFSGRWEVGGEGFEVRVSMFSPHQVSCRGDHIEIANSDKCVILGWYQQNSK